MIEVSWRGDKSQRWPSAPIWSLGDKVLTRNTDLVEKGLLSLSHGRVISRSMTDAGGLRPGSYETYQIVEPGDVIFRFTDLQNDQRSLRTGLVETRGIMTSAYLNFRPGALLEPRYFAYLMRSYDTRKVFYNMGTGVRQNLNFDEFSKLHVPVPPYPEQQRIADYLDFETLQIDEMRYELNGLIGTLQERRVRSVRTLGSSLATSNDRVVAIKFLLRKCSRPVMDADTVVTAFRDGQVTSRSKRRETGFTMSAKEHGYQGIEPGDFVFHGLDGFAGAIGVSDSRGKASPVYHVCEASSLTTEQFMAWALRALGAAGYLEAHSWSVRQRSVDYRNWETFSSLKIHLPDLDIQHDWVQLIERETKAIDVLIAEARHLQKLLNERRSALINDVVTGRKEIA